MNTVGLLQEDKVVEIPTCNLASQQAQAIEIASNLFYEAKKTGGVGPDTIKQTSERQRENRLVIKTSDGIGWGRLCIEGDVNREEDATLLALRMVLRIKSTDDGFHKLKSQIGFRAVENRKHVILHKESHPLRFPLNEWCELTGVFSALKFEKQKKVIFLLPLLPDCDIEIDHYEMISKAARLVDRKLDSELGIDVLEKFSVKKLETLRGNPQYDKVKIYSQGLKYQAGLVSGHIYSSGLISHVDFSSNLDCQSKQVAVNRDALFYRGYIVEAGYQIDLGENAPDSILMNINATTIDQPQIRLCLHEGRIKNLLTSLIDTNYIISQLPCDEFAGLSSADKKSKVIDKLKESSRTGIWPNPLFDPDLVQQNLGLEKMMSVYDLLITYIENSSLWEAKTSFLFDPKRFTTVGGEPMLVRYLSDPTLWTMSPHELFCPEYYSQSVTRLELTSEAPLAQYLKLSPQLRVDPHPVFKTYFYSTQYEEVWEGKITALDHFVKTGLGEPISGFNQFLKEMEVEPRDRGRDRCSLLIKYERDLKVFISMEPGRQNAVKANPLIIQMTPKNAQNPYYRQLPHIFKNVEIDYRFSMEIDELVKWSANTSRPMTLWFHQLEPFYHLGDRKSTAERIDRLLESFRLLKKNGVKLVHTWHNAFPHDPNFIELDSRLYCEMDEFFDLIIVHSKVAVNWVRQFCNTTPIEVLPHPAIGHQIPRTTNKSLARKILKLPENKTIYISFGQIKPYKSINTLIYAWKEYKNQHEDSESLLLIEGKWSKDISKSVLKDLKSIIVNDSEVDNDRLGLLLAAADICVITHKNIWVSGVAMAALQFDMPLIVPDNSGLTEIIFEPDNGYIFKGGDYRSLVDCFKRVQQSNNIKSIVYNNKSLNSQFQPKAIQDKYIHAFKPLINAKQA